MILRLWVQLITLAVGVEVLAAQEPAPPPPPAPAPAPAPPPVAQPAPPPAQPRPPKSSSTLITADDIDNVRSSAANGYDAVRLLRPRWLRTDVLRLPGAHGDMQSQRIHVFMDDRDMGDLEYLRSIPAGDIFTLRFMSMAEVGARFGPSSGPGIVVTLKR